MQRTTDKFRAAVSAGKFTDANDLLAEMRSEVEDEWNCAGSPDERQRIAAETTKLLYWARMTILTSRAHTQSKLAALKRESAYIEIRRQAYSQLDVEV